MIRCQGENLACLSCQAKTDVLYPFLLHQEKKPGGFLGGPVVKTSSSNAGDAGSIPGQGVLRSHMPKNQNIKQKQHFNKFSKELQKLSTSKNKQTKQTESQHSHTAVGSKIPLPLPLPQMKPWKSQPHCL